MAFTALTTLQTTIAANIDYTVDADVAKARLLLAALNEYRLALPQETEHNAKRLRYDMNQINGLIQDTKAFLAANPIGGASSHVRHANFAGFRE